MSAFHGGVRIGAVAFALGLSVVGPQAIAAADSGGNDSGAQQTTAAHQRAPRGTARTAPKSSARQRSVARASASRSAARKSAAVVRPPAAATAAIRDGQTAVRGSDVRQALPAAARTPQSAAVGSPAGAGQSASPPIDGRNRPLLELPKRALIVTNYRIHNMIYGVLDVTSKLLSLLPSNPITDLLQGAFLLVRRTFFDQAPTLDPVQTTGQTGGQISGTLGGADPEGDPITYSVFQAPRNGTLTINPDGTYVYTPGLGFDGSDSFIVEATDKTPTARLATAGRPTAAATLPWRRAKYAYAYGSVGRNVVNKITFKFTPAGGAYVNADYARNPLALPLLKMAADDLAKAFVVTYPVVLNYEYGLVDSGLAKTTNKWSSTEVDRFDITKTQAKITKNVDPTGGDVDAILSFNFDRSWNYNKTVGPKEYNFYSVATHEMLHAFGFSDDVRKPGCNVDRCVAGVPTLQPKTSWNYFDSFIGDWSGEFAITKSSMRWDKAFDTNVTAGNWQNGLYFLGTNAEAAFGGPVPLYSPKDYDGGSTGSHLSDFYFDNTDLSAEDGIQMMNAIDKRGVAVPVTLSKVEIGILKDLGYTMK